MFFSEESNEQVIPLLTIDDRGAFHVSEEAREWLQAEGCVPLSVVAVVGKYRTGKSALMNRLLGGTGGFSVGNTVQACTKGIWIHKQIVHTGDSEDGEKHILFMDTEGIGSLDATSEHDLKITVATLLLSSLLLYNSVGPIDEAALQNLYIMIRASEELRDGGDAAFPRFLWVMRDLALRLESPEGRRLQPDEYLEAALLDAADGEDSRSEIRTCLKRCFPYRGAAVLPRPCADEALARIDADPSLTTDAFKRDVSALHKRVRREVPPLRIRDDASGGVDRVITPAAFIALCDHVASALNKNDLPALNDTYKLLGEIRARDERDVCLVEAEATFASLRLVGLRAADELDVKLAGIEQAAASRMEAACPSAVGVARALDERLRAMSDDMRTHNLKLATESAESATRDVSAIVGSDVDDAIATYLRHDQGVFLRCGPVRDMWASAVARVAPDWMRSAARPSMREAELEELNVRAARELETTEVRLTAQVERMGQSEIELKKQLAELSRLHEHELSLLHASRDEATSRLATMEDKLVEMAAERATEEIGIGETVGTEQPSETAADNADNANNADNADVAQRETDQLRRQAVDASDEAASLRYERDQLRDELTASRHRNEQHGDEMNQLAERHQEQLVTSYARAQEATAKLQARLDDAQRSVAALRDERDEVRFALDRKNEVHASDKSLSSDKLAAAEVRVADLTEKQRLSHERELEFVREREMRQKQHDEERLVIRMDGQKLHRSLASHETELRMLRKRTSDYDDVQQQVKRLRATNDAQGRDIVRAQAERAALETRMKELRCEAAKMQAANSCLQRDNAAILREIDLIKEASSYR